MEVYCEKIACHCLIMIRVDFKVVLSHLALTGFWIYWSSIKHTSLQCHLKVWAWVWISVNSFSFEVQNVWETEIGRKYHTALFFLSLIVCAPPAINLKLNIVLHNLQLWVLQVLDKATEDCISQKAILHMHSIGSYGCLRLSARRLSDDDSWNDHMHTFEWDVQQSSASKAVGNSLQGQAHSQLCAQ